MSELLDLQKQFSQMIASFILWLYDSGYTVTCGEFYRSPAEAELNAQQGIGIANSLHTQKLAADLNIFKPDGSLCETVEDYTEAGEEWERRGGSWGGRFARPDCDHFSLEWGGVK